MRSECFQIHRWKEKLTTYQYQRLCCSSARFVSWSYLPMHLRAGQLWWTLTKQTRDIAVYNQQADIVWQQQRKETAWCFSREEERMQDGTIGASRNVNEARKVPSEDATMWRKTYAGNQNIVGVREIRCQGALQVEKTTVPAKQHATWSMRTIIDSIIFQVKLSSARPMVAMVWAPYQLIEAEDIRILTELCPLQVFSQKLHKSWLDVRRGLT